MYQTDLKPKLDKITADIAAAEEALSSEMGFHGGRMNQNYEVRRLGNQLYYSMDADSSHYIIATKRRRSSICRNTRI